MFIVLALGILFLIGCAVALPVRASVSRPEYVVLAFGLGALITSLLLLVAVAVHLSWGAYLFTEAAAVSAAIFALVRTPRLTLVTVPNLSTTTRSHFMRLLATCFVVTCAAAASVFAVRAVEGSHGSWDAWVEWNLRARFISASVLDRVPFDWQLMSGQHPSYPFLVSLSSARLAIFEHANDVRAGSIPIAALFTFGSLALLVASVSVDRGSETALFSGVLLIAASSFFEIGSWQCADVPLSFFQLATIVLLVRHYGERWSPRGDAILGLMAGGAAWTKNEGLAFAAMTTVVILILPAAGRSRFGTAARLVCGAAPAIAASLLVKLGAVAPATSAPSVQNLVNPQRWLITLRGFALPSIAIFVAPIAFVLLIGAHKRFLRSRPTAAAALLLGGTIASWLIFLVAASTALEWQVEASAERLLVQIAPAVLFVVFRGSKSFTERWSGAPNPPGEIA